MATIADLGLLGALVPAESGGLGLPLPTAVRLVEELARGWTVVAGIVAAHLTVTDTLARFAPRDWRSRLPAMTCAETWGAAALGGEVSATRDGDGRILNGRTGLVDNAERAGLFLVLARGEDGRPLLAVVPRASAALHVEPAPETIGARGLGAGHLVFSGVRVTDASVLGEDAAARARAVARLGLAATGVGLARAALEAALRYSRERTAFGQAICQHQAVQLKLADMATAITTARLITVSAAQNAGADTAVSMARLAATETASRVTLEAMRIHGGYGYTTDFAVERYYRDVPRLVLALGGNDRERDDLGRKLVAR
jgi:alkylation response protein AidB-like acyl-CoA dehydrogenase